jgi:hypothetical protein
LPFDESENIGKLLVSICTDSVLPPSMLVPAFSIEVDRFFEKALSRDMKTRFQSMAELVEAFGVCAGIRAPRTTLLIGSEKRDPVADRALETEITLSIDPVVAKSADRASSRNESGETRGSLAPSESGERGGSSRKRFVPIILGAVGLVAALGVAFVMRGSEGAGGKTPVPEDTATNPADVPVVSPSVAMADAIREVSVTIDPPDATVEVAGRVVTVNGNGTITISGELGSLHPVRIYKDKLEFRTDVAITAKGPMPEKLALPATKPAASTVTAAVTTPVTTTKDPGPGVTTPQPTSPPTQPTTTKTTKPPTGDPGPDRNFQ